MRAGLLVRTRALSRAIGCVLVLASLQACASLGDLTGPKLRPSSVSNVELTAPSETVPIGGTLALQATAFDIRGKAVADKAVFWTSSDETVAKVSSAGVVSALKIGTVQIAASVDGRSAVTVLTITKRAVANVVVTPSAPTIFVGATVQMSATTLDDAGVALTDRTVFWATSDANVAVVDALGVVMGVAPGVTSITAISENRSSSVGVTVQQVPVASVLVTPPLDSVVVGQTTQFNAVARDATGAVLPGRLIVWSSSNSAVATVSSSGLVLGLTAGTISVVATCEGRTSSATVVVTPRPVGSVIVSPSSSVLNVGQTLKLSVVITDNNGQLLTNRPIQYSSSNASVAQVASDGTVTAVRIGTATILVQSEGKSGEASIEVTASPIANVAVQPSTATLNVGSTLKLTAIATDAAGVVLGQRPVTWTSGAPGIATVAADGTVSAIGAGTALIFATVEGRMATATITVQNVPVASVVVTPPAPTIIVGDALNLVAQPRDANGVALSGKVVQWTSTNNTVAVVSSTGRVRAIAPGQTLIEATVEGVKGSSAVSTIIEPVLSILLLPNALGLIPGQSATVVATPQGRNGIALNGRVVTFTSLNTAIATVTATGLVTAVAQGTTSITVQCEGVITSLPVNVSPTPVATVQVVLTAPDLFVGEHTTAIATTRDVDGNILTGRQVQWTSTNNSIATVSATGQVTAIAPGQADIKASSEGKTGFATVKVALVPVATVTVVLPSAGLFVLQTETASAVLKDAAGNVLTGRPIVWTSSDPTVATVSSTGVVSAVAPGNANITASSEGKSGQAALQVALAPVATVSVSISPPTIFVGSTVNASVVTRDAGGNILTGRTIAWSSTNTSVATVSNTGVVTAVAPGQASIEALSEGITGSATVTVQLVPVAVVNVALGNGGLTVGQTTQATAETRDAQGNLLNGRPIVWSSSDLTIATVNAQGLVTAVAPGTASIIATSGSVSGSAPVTVSLVPVASVTVSLASSSLYITQTTNATAELRDASNNVLSGRPIVWSSSNPNVATVSNTGVVTAVAPGTTNITAQSGSASGSAQLTAALVPVATVSVALNASNIFVAASTQAVVTLRDTANNVLSGRTVTWSSSDNSVATVSAAGIVTGVAQGTANIIAMSEGQSGQAAVQVAIAPVASVTVALGATSIANGATTQATATLRDALNNVLFGRVVDWTSSNPAVATVDAGGLVTAVGVGSADIIAQSEGKGGQATLSVTAVPVASVSVSVNPNSLTVGETAQASAVTRDANNNMLAGRLVAWSSSNSGVASVDQAGVVTAVAAGTANIIATSEGVSGQAGITIADVPVATVSVSLQANSLTVGQTTLASAITRDAGNNVLNGRTVVWSSSNNAIATVTQGGVVSAVGAGTVDIIATSEGKVGQASLTVALVPVATVTVALNAPSLTVGQLTQASATTRDANGNILNGRTIVWSSSDNAVATVDGAGVVTAVAQGTANIIATSEGQSGQAALTVTAAPVASISVGVTPSTIVIGQTGQAAATLRDANNNVLNGRTVVWSSSNTAVATVDVNGVVTAVAAGTAGILATSEGVTDSATVTVIAEPVASVSVSLGNPTVPVGQTTQATATLKDAANNVLNGRTVVWTSSDTSVATVDANGVVTAVAAGTADIIATSEGKSGMATVTVP